MEKGSKPDEILTLAFMILAIASVVVLLVVNTRTSFFYCAGAAILLRIVQYILRFIK